MGTLLAALWLYDRWIGGEARLFTGWAFAAAILFSGCCLVSRRLHDLGWAGWWTALYFALFPWAWPHPAGWAGVAFGLLALPLCVLPGERAPNRFGPAWGATVLAPIKGRSALRP